MEILNLGCGTKKMTNAINLDKSLEYKPDILWDLEKTETPFFDEQFDEIHAHHVLEHITNLEPLLKEIERILKPKGKAYVSFPHYSNNDAKKDATHKSLQLMHSKIFEWNTNLKNEKIEYTPKPMIIKPIIEWIGFEKYEEWLSQYFQITELKITLNKKGKKQKHY